MIALRAPRLGGGRLVRLVDEGDGIDWLLRAPRSDLKSAGLADEAIRALRSPDAALLEQDRAWLQQAGHHLLTWTCDQFPPLLRDIPAPPPALFVDGDPDVLWQPQIAVIGSRNPTTGGRDNACDFAGELSRAGMTVTSGLADGIDSVAHRAAIEAGGRTVAVLGTGIDRVYPRGGESLAAAVRDAGALVSEYPPGTPARRGHFPARNRIISGLSLGVLVIEAGLRSGTLITARQAGNQGREVFALPGSIHNPMAKGCHRLIRDGARLVENVADIMSELAPLAGQLAGALRAQLQAESSGETGPRLELPEDEPHFDGDAEYLRLWSAIGYDPKPIDAIIEQSGLTARAVSAMLLMLELRGMVEAHPGKAYSRTTRGQE